MSRTKSRVHPRYKTKYRVGNWTSYDRSLVARGSITLWLSPDAIAAWTPAPTRRRGGPRKFSDLQARVENTFFRYKTILGGRLRARGAVAQVVEARIACDILNRMTALGKPESYAVRR